MTQPFKRKHIGMTSSFETQVLDALEIISLQLDYLIMNTQPPTLEITQVSPVSQCLCHLKDISSGIIPCPLHGG